MPFSHSKWRITWNFINSVNSIKHYTFSHFVNFYFHFLWISIAKPRWRSIIFSWTLVLSRVGMASTFSHCSVRQGQSDVLFLRLYYSWEVSLSSYSKLWWTAYAGTVTFFIHTHLYARIVTINSTCSDFYFVFFSSY